MEPKAYDGRIPCSLTEGRNTMTMIVVAVPHLPIHYEPPPDYKPSPPPPEPSALQPLVSVDDLPTVDLDIYA
jgi:hypothetical protein